MVDGYRATLAQRSVGWPEEVVTGPTTLARLHHPRCLAQPLYGKGASQHRRSEHLASLPNPFMVTRLATNARGDRVLWRHPISPTQDQPTHPDRRFCACGGRQRPTGAPCERGSTVVPHAPGRRALLGSMAPPLALASERKRPRKLCRGNIIKCSLKTGLASAE